MTTLSFPHLQLVDILLECIYNPLNRSETFLKPLTIIRTRFDSFKRLVSTLLDHALQLSISHFLLLFKSFLKLI